MLWHSIRDLVTRLLHGPRTKSAGKQLWCVVANVVTEHSVGVDKEIKRGTKHFSAGTKVYVYPPLWGDGYEKVKVIGRHRASRGLVEIVMPSKWLTNWRVKMVYSPFVVSHMKDQWDDSEESQRKAAVAVAEMTRRAP